MVSQHVQLGILALLSCRIVAAPNNLPAAWASTQLWSPTTTSCLTDLDPSSMTTMATPSITSPFSDDPNSTPSISSPVLISDDPNSPPSISTPSPTIVNTRSTSPAASRTDIPVAQLGKGCPADTLADSDSGTGLSSVSNKCGFAADSNIYGLGVRLGLYIQWFTSLIVYNIISDEAFTIGSLNFIFQLSNFVSLLFITSTRARHGGHLYAAECWIVLLICTGAVFPGIILSPDHETQEQSRSSPNNESAQRLTTDAGGVPSTSNVQTEIKEESRFPEPNNESAQHLTTYAGGVRLSSTPSNDSLPAKVSKVGEILQQLLSIAVQLYAIWFVFKGLDEMFAPVNSRSAFAFAKVNLYHRFRTFLKFFFVVLTALTVFELGVVTFGPRPFVLVSTHLKHNIGFILNTIGIVWLLKQLYQGENFDAIVQQANQRLRALQPDVSIFVNFFLLVWIGFVVVSIEMAIVWNHVSGANAFDSGQWLVLVGATAGFIRVLYIWLGRELWSMRNGTRHPKLKHSLIIFAQDMEGPILQWGQRISGYLPSLSLAGLLTSGEQQGAINAQAAPGH